MISKLPSWIWPITWVLAVIAGMVNVVGLVSSEHQAITHLTGTTSLIADAISRLDGRSALRLAGVIGAFLSGTILSGLVVQDAALKLGRRYAAALAFEAVLLVSAAILLHYQRLEGIYCAASACGLQNAMISTFSGAVVRTTHVSGMFTDLGVYLGHAMRGLPVDKRRLGLSVLVISGFLVGGIVGATAYHVFSFYALLIPALLSAVASASAWKWGHRQNAFGQSRAGQVSGEAG